MRSRLILIIFIVCFNSVSTFGFWGTLISSFIKVSDTVTENSDKINSGLNIGEKLGIISSKDLYDAKKNLYQVKKFKSTSVYDNAWEHLVDSDTKHSFNDIRYISRELNTITGVNAVKNSEDWARTALSDIYRSLLYQSPQLTSETMAEIQGYTKTQDNLNLDQAANQLETTMASYQSLKHDAAQTDYLSKLATTSKASFDLQASEIALKDAEKKEADDSQAKLNEKMKAFNEPETKPYKSIFTKGAIRSNLINENAVIQKRISTEFKLYLISFFFLVAIVWRYIEIIISDEQKSFPIVPLMAHFLAGILLLTYSEHLFSFIVEIANEMTVLIKQSSFYAKGSLLDEYLKHHSVSLKDLSIMRVGELITNGLLFFINILISLVDVLLTYIRDYILLIIYFAFPLIVSLSLLPLFSFKLILKSVILFIQVASWSILSALFFGLYASTIGSFNVNNLNLSYYTAGTEFAIQSIIKGIIAVAIGIFIPRLSFALIGGTDMSFIPVAATSLGFGAASVALDKNKRNGLVNMLTNTTGTAKNTVENVASYFTNQPPQGFNPADTYRKSK